MILVVWKSCGRTRILLSQRAGNLFQDRTISVEFERKHRTQQVLQALENPTIGPLRSIWHHFELQNVATERVWGKIMFFQNFEKSIFFEIRSNTFQNLRKFEIRITKDFGGSDPWDWQEIGGIYGIEVGENSPPPPEVWMCLWARRMLERIGWQKCEVTIVKITFSSPDSCGVNRALDHLNSLVIKRSQVDLPLWIFKSTDQSKSPKKLFSWTVAKI